MTQRKKTSARLLSLVLAVVMVFSMLPTAAFAAGGETITFDARNGVAIAPVEIVDGTVTLPEVPTWNDYTFGGWYTDIDGTTGTEFVNSGLSASATVYAKWTQDSITVRTEALDLTGTPTPAPDQGWTWDDGTSTLTLDGAIFDLTYTKVAEKMDVGSTLMTYGYAIQTKSDTVIDLVGTSSVIGPEVFSDRVPAENKTSSAISTGVLVQGACTVKGAGSLTAQGGKAIYGVVTVSTTSDRAGVSTVNAGIYCNESASQDLTEGRLTVESGTIIAKGGSYQNDATVTGGGSCTNNSSGLLAVRYTQSGGTVTGESGAEAGLSMAVGVFATMEAVLTGGVLNGACTASSAISPSAIKVPAYALGEGGGRPGGFSAENALYKGSATADGELIKAELASGSFTVDGTPAMKVNITFPPTIKLGAQTGPATFGTEANATYTVTAKGFGENDFPAYDPSIQWKSGEAWSTTAPTGVTAALNDQKNSVSVTYDGASNAGDYLFRVVSPEASPLTGNYASADTTFTVGKASYTGTAIIKTISQTVNKPGASGATLTATDITDLPGATITAIIGNTTNVLTAVPVLADGTVTYSTENVSSPATDEYTLTISTTNYNDITAALTFAAVSKTDVIVDVTAVSIPGVAEGKITYTGNAMTHAGTPTADGVPADGFTYTWQKKNSGGTYETVAEAKGAGDYKLIVSVSDSNEVYQGKGEIAFTIEAKALTVTGLTATNRVYDSTTAVTLTGGTLVGVVPGDTVTAAMPTTGAIAAAGIGTGKSVTLAAITLGGAEKNNYTLTQPTATVNITAAEIEVTGNGTYAVTKVYDGTTNPGIGSGALTFTGTVGSETVSVTATVGAYADANVGTGKTVTLTLALDGTGKGNYVLKSGTYSFNAAAITKGTYSGDAAAKTVEVMIKKAATQPGTLTAGDFFASAPAGARITAVSVQTAANNILSSTPTVTDGTLSYTGAANLTTKDLTDTYNVTISTTNYNDITATLTVKTVDKTVVTVTATDVSIPGVAEGKITYTGSAIGNPTGTPTASAGGLTVADFEYVWQKKNSGGSYETVTQSDVKNAGDYQLIAKVKESNEAYQGSAAPILFTITKAVVTEPTIPSKVYSGSAQTADVPASDRWTVTTNNGGTGSVDAETEYDVVLTLTDSTNYKWSTVDTQTVTLKFKIINKTEVVIGGTIKVDGLDGDNKITYGGTAVTMSGTTTAPNVPADGFTYTWQKKNGGSYENIPNNVAPTNAGDYKLIVAVKSDNADYMGSKEIEFTIAKKPITVSVKNVGINTGSAVPAFGLTFDGLIGNDVITLTPTPVFECKKDGVTVDGKTAGTYDIVWTNRADATVTGDENYNVTLPDAANAKGTLTVTTPSSGGGSYTPPAGVVIDGKTENLGTVSTKNGTTTVTLDEKKLNDKLADAKDGSSVVIPVSGSANSAAAQLTGKSVEDMAKKDMTLTVQAKGVTYEMPASAVDTAGVLAELGATDASKVPFTVTVTQEKNLKVEDATVIGTPVSFTVTATYNGKSVTVDRFSAMVARSIEITKEQAGKITTAVVVVNGKIVRHVPTDVYELNGKWYAKINSMTNSTYTLIENESVFTDVAGKWYAAAADELSAREVTKNVFDTAFEGEKNITRAEFAALLVNALGLPATENATFDDVASDAWYSKVVATASRYGIVKGVGRNNFAPNATITRQEAMVMMARAAEVAGWAGDGQAAAGFTDLDQVAKWAAEGVDFNTANGLIVGIGGMVKPNDTITRGETATVLLRLLQKAELVDVRSKV